VPGFFELWSEFPERLCPHLHVPLQAGADKQLRAMARRCTTTSFRTLVEEARVAIPNLVVTTDLIAGFPGESDEDFLRGADFVREMRFVGAHIFPYSKRAGTAAANFRDEPPGDIKRARARHLQEIVAATGAVERGRHLGTVRPVLWEGEGKPLGETGFAEWEGFTDNYLRVRTSAPLGVDLHNTITHALLSSAEGEMMLAETTLPQADLRSGTMIR
jgi:threonylcarbamoyladenosine tRNA methylthiotransferase MtaB